MNLATKYPEEVQAIFDKYPVKRSAVMPLLYLAQREGASAEDLKQSLRQIGLASIRATHTVNQLLALARAESSGAAMPRQRCDLAELTMSVVRDSVPRAIEKQIDLGYEGAEPGAPGGQLWGNPTLLKELVRNLVDNAINYTPSSAAHPGVITVRVVTDPGGETALLQVEELRITHVLVRRCGPCG